MRAARYATYGTADVIHVEEMDVPTPKDGEILVRVCAATVSRTDCANLTAHPFIMRFMIGLSAPKRQTLGTDFAGRVEAIGANVRKFAVGDLVWGFEDSGASSHAEYLVIAEKHAEAIPPNLDLKDAAACLEGAFYAWNFLNKVSLGPASRVMINGATGAIGSALLQMCVDAGAKVTAVGNTQNLGLLRALGAERVIDFTTEDFTASPGGFDLVLDAVGKSTFGRCRRLLTPNGIYISSELGPGCQNLILPLFTRLDGGQRVIFPIPTDKDRFFKHVYALVKGGRFRPVVDRRFALNEVREAYRYAASGQKTGCVMLDLDLDRNQQGAESL